MLEDMYNYIAPISCVRLGRCLYMATFRLAMGKTEIDKNDWETLVSYVLSDYKR